MTALAPHQRPWLHDVFQGAGGGTLEDALIEIGRARATWLKRVIALVGGDHGYWREERLIEGLDGSLVLEIDSHRGARPYEEALPAELCGAYERLIAVVRDLETRWPGQGGVKKEPGASPRGGEMVVVIEAATLRASALVGDSAVDAFRRVVFPGLDVAGLRRSSGT